MSQFKLIEVKSVTGKNYFVEGYVSTVDSDFVNDIVDEEGQKATYREITNSDITMDEDHSEWRDPKTGKLYDGKKNKYPIAKVVSSKLDSKGTWVKAKLNKYHPDFYERILPMVKDKMLHSFSIAYKVKDYFYKVMNGVKYRIIKDLAIANIAITGNPVNKNATFNMALKSFPKMVEEEVKTETETQVEETKVEETPEQEQEVTEAEVETKGMDYKKMYSELKAKYDKLKGNKTEMKSFNDRITSLEESNEELIKENAELKSFVESPQLKSIVEGTTKEPQTKTEVTRVTMWDVM
jgi:myosin heavy subunit